MTQKNARQLNHLTGLRDHSLAYSSTSLGIHCIYSFARFNRANEVACEETQEKTQADEHNRTDELAVDRVIQYSMCRFPTKQFHSAKTTFDAKETKMTLNAEETKMTLNA